LDGIHDVVLLGKNGSLIYIIFVLLQEGLGVVSILSITTELNHFDVVALAIDL
jgi:hypothetical protein